MIKSKFLIIAFFIVIYFAGCTSTTQKSSVAMKTLSVIKKLNIGSCMDATVHGNLLFVVGSKTIYSYDISSPEEPVLLDKLSGLGNVRQIELQNGYAYVTAREEGLFIIDISNPRSLKKMAHYDTLELGTGVAVSGSIAAVTNRQYGLEFLDVSNPEKPSFLSKIITGEAQSVFLKDSLAVVGDWGTKEVVLVSISNPSKPKIISRIELDGYGDGVFVKGNLCFAATGHHARGWKKGSSDSTYWGKGHGMEIIDISDPLQPKKLSTLKFPIKYYQLYADMWDVQVSGNHAFVGDSEGGIFVVDVSDPYNPVIVSNAGIPVPDMPDYMQSLFKAGKKSGPVGGFAIGNGVVYIAGLMGDLYISEAPMATKLVAKNRKKIKIEEVENNHSLLLSSYAAGGQVHSAFVINDEHKILVAAGDGGVHKVLLKPQIYGEQLLETGTTVFDVFWDKETLYLAEGIDGFSVWNYNGHDIPQLINRYTSENGGIYQLLINPELKLAILHAGADHLEILDCQDFNNLKILTSYKPYSGLMYRFPIANSFLNDRFVASSWHTTGCYFYDLKSEKGVEFLGNFIPPLGVINGIAFMQDKVLAILDGGYIVQNPPNKPQLELGEPITIENIYLKGKPTIYNNSTLYVSNRMKGNIFSVDIGNLKLPKENWKLQINGNPGLIRESGDMLIVPAGHSGLLILNKFTGKHFYSED